LAAGVDRACDPDVDAQLCGPHAEPDQLALDEVALVGRVLIAEQGDLPLVGRQRRAEALISSSFARYVFPAPGRPTIR
jgi:hypothetical protein